MSGKRLFSALLLIVLICGMFMSSCREDGSGTAATGTDASGVPTDAATGPDEGNAVLSWDELSAQKHRYIEDAAFENGVKLRFVTFDDIAPEGYRLKESWDSMGIDDRNRVYIGWTSLRPDGKEDYVIFRYDNSTGERKLLGTFMQASEEAGNLLPDEQIPKGHTKLIFAEGKIYMGSQSFHDFKYELDGLEDMRGSHIYAYDIEKDKLEDVSAGLPGGVVTQHQGIVAMTYMPEEKLLVGLTHPMSDIVLFDITDNTIRQVIEGIPWKLGNPVSREIVATKYGKIYTYRGTESPNDRNKSFYMYEYDIASGEMKKTDYKFDNGFWNGQTASLDGEKIYITTVNGRLYVLNTKEGSVESLGHFLPREDTDGGGLITFLYSITLSEDGRYVYGIPTESYGGLYAYDTKEKSVSKIVSLTDARYTGSGIRDADGHLYFGRFGSKTEWSYDARLLILNLSGYNNTIE